MAPPSKKHMRQRMLTVFFALVHTLVVFLFIVLPLLDSHIVHAYTQIAMPTAPGTFVSTRGTAFSIVACLTVLNLMLPFLLLFALLNSDIQEWRLGKSMLSLF